MPSLGDLVVRIVGDNSDFNAKVDDSEKRFIRFGESMAKVGKKLTTFVTLPLVGLGVAAVKSFADQETALKRLDSAILLSGGHTAGASLRMQEFATNVMRATGVADELLENLISQAILMGRTEEEAKKLTMAAVDIAATGIMPLETAFETLSVTYEGIGIRSKELRALTGDLTEEQLRSGAAIDIVGKAVAGAGAEMRKTTAGGLAALRTNLGELGESIGAILIPEINRAVGFVSGMVDKFMAMDETTKRVILSIVGVAAAVGPLLLVMGKLIPVVIALNAAMAANPWAIAAVAIGAVVTVIAGYSIAKGLAQKATEDHRKAVMADTEALTKNAAAEQRRLLLIDIGIAKGALAANARDKQTTAIVAERIELEKYLAGLEAELAILDSGKPKVYTAEQLRIVKATEDIATGLRHVTEQSKLAALAGEDFNEIEERRAVVLSEIRKLIEEGFTIEGTGIKSLLAQYPKLLETQKIIETEAEREIALIQERNRLRGLSIESMAAEAEAEAEKAKQSRIEAAAEIAQVEEVADRTAELRAAGEAGREAAHQRELARIKSENDATVSAALFVYGQIREISRLILEQRRADIERESEAWLSAIERNRDAAIEAAGLQEQTTLDRLKEELAAAIAKGDTEAAALLQDDIARETALAEINDKFDKEKAAAMEELDKKRRQLAHDQAIANKAFALIDIGINTARGVVQALASLPPPLSFVMAAITAAMGIAQAAIVASQPIPPLAEGGVVMPRPGGVQATIAEAGQPEAVIPLDRLDSMLSRWPGSDGGDGGDIHLQVNIDSDPIMRKIFPATRNRLVLIDAGAVV